MHWTEMKILVLLLDGQIILAYQSLENPIIIDVLGGKVRKDIRKLPKELRCLETLIQRLPGYIGYILLAQQELVQNHQKL